MLRMGLCFILIEAHSILPSPSGGFSTLLMLCSLFLRKVILLTMLAVNVFSSISKKEETNRKCYRSLTELQLSVFEYIEGYYNTKRPHGTLNMLTPSEAEALYWEQTK